MDKQELEKLGAATLADIIYNEITVLNSKIKEIQENQKYSYGVLIAKTWYWYESWLKVVNDYCRDNEEQLK